MKFFEDIDSGGKKHPYIIYGKENNGKDVDVLMPAYNHAEYIAQAIESILEQKTEYSYRIIIGEDCSTDSTLDIAMKYYYRYPHRITLIQWEHNVGVAINSKKMLEYADAKYIAHLEGDDYWTNSLKLEKQVSFLEKNKDFIGVCHNVRCINAEGIFLRRDFGLYPIRDEHIYGAVNARRFELAAQTASMVYHNIWKDMSEVQIEQFCECRGNGDIKTCILLGFQGKVFFMKDIMANHRRVFKGDSWTARTYNKNLSWSMYQFHKDFQRYIRESIGEEMVSLKEGYTRTSLIRFMETLKFRDLIVFLRLKMLG